ncbi:MAG TPA: ECF RNA polymerase sigma factor SigK [Streptosporangiaceae bacterium]
MELSQTDDARGGAPRGLEGLLGDVARGDQQAFEAVYRQVAAPVYGLARRVVRDPALAEEVSQEVLVTVWRTAARFDADRGSALAWVMTLTHRRAVDRVRSEQAATDREERARRAEPPPFDEVTELVENRMQAERVRRCLGTLTDLQNEALRLSYYQGYTYREVSSLLAVPLGTIKSRMRDGLIRLRDCLGVEW